MIASLATSCPKQLPPLERVYADFLLAPKQRQGFMHCFCLAFYVAEGGVGSALKQLQTYKPDLTENPCDQWRFYYENSFILTILTGAAVGLINSLTVMLFELLAPLEKCLTHA